MGNTNMRTNTNRNTKAKENQGAAAKMQGCVLSGTRDGAVRLTLPKGTYTIDGDGNLIIHGGGKISGGEAGGMPSPACPGLSYEEFMEKPDGRGAEGSTDEGGDPFGMDFSALGADPEKLVGECRGTVYGYARCSTLHQDYQRQINALLKLGIRDENIFKDKKSGKDFNREEFQKLMNVLQPGDCIVVVELDRFGRNMAEIKKHWFWITQQKKADIIVLDQPVLNTRIGAHGLGAFLADLILAVFSLMAEIERNLINKRMEDGIRLARLAGKKLGRKIMAIPVMFWKFKDMFLNGKISQNKASQRLGVDPKTFRSWMERTGDISDAQEWEELKAWIEEQEKEERIRQAKMKYGETSESVADMSREAMQKTAMVQETNAGCTDTAARQDISAESGRTDADGKKGCVRRSMKKPHKATEGAGNGAAGNPARSDGGAVEKGRRNHRKSKSQKLFGEAKKKTALGRKARQKNRRI